MQTEKAKSSHFDRTRGFKNQIFPTQDPSEVHEDTTVVPIIETDDYLEYQLPFGWKKVGKKRKNDGINRRWDFYIYTPWGEQLRSNPEISSYLDRHPDTKCDRKVTNTGYLISN